MKSVLVTGGTGFIGSHTCLLLLKKGYEVTVFDSLVNSSIESIDRVIKILSTDIDIKRVRNKLNFIKGDIRNKGALDKVFHSAKTKGKNIQIAQLMFLLRLMMAKKS